MFVDECHVTRLNQGLFSTTMEAEKRDPGNEVGIYSGTGSKYKWKSPLHCNEYFRTTKTSAIIVIKKFFS